MIQKGNSDSQDILDDSFDTGDEEAKQMVIIDMHMMRPVWPWRVMHLPSLENSDTRASSSCVSQQEEPCNSPKLLSGP